MTGWRLDATTALEDTNEQQCKILSFPGAVFSLKAVLYMHISVKLRRADDAFDRGSYFGYDICRLYDDHEPGRTPAGAITCDHAARL